MAMVGGLVDVVIVTGISEINLSFLLPILYDAINASTEV